jgi:hypothetical protein
MVGRRTMPLEARVRVAVIAKQYLIDPIVSTVWHSIEQRRQRNIFLIPTLCHHLNGRHDLHLRRGESNDKGR